MTRTQTAATDAEKLVQLDPAVILADDNARHSLKATRLESLKTSILESGGVLSPVEVELLPKPSNGHTHRLTSGYYRHAAVTALNKDGANMMLPAIVRTVDERGRLMHQLTENIERENQSPMDMAVSIKKLLDSGVSRGEIRRIYARPSGRKGNTLVPASNAWVNIVVRLLELPKAVQEKIHDGRVGFAAAYELGRVSPEKRAAVLERAEAERLAQIEREEKDEEKYLNAEKKAAEAEEKVKAALAEAEELRAAEKAARALAEEKRKALKAVEKTPYLDKSEDEKKAMMESVKAAQVDVKAADKIVKDTANKLAKAIERTKTAAELAEEKKAQLEAARKAVKPKKPTAVGPDDIKKAAKAEGAETGVVLLSASDMRQALKDVAKAEYPKVAAIAAALQACFASKTTPKELIEDLAVITGEKPKPVVKAKK